MPRIFDAEHYESLNASRDAVVSALLSELMQPLGLRTALDVGSGLGYFSGLLRTFGFEVSAVDGRQQNVEEARRRFPQIPFQRCDAQDITLRDLGKFDLILCFGLLYHLENPMLTVRHLRAMTKQLLLIEAVIYPGEQPIMALVDEGPTEDQGLNHVAFYPTEACLVKMLYRSGFSNVYGFKIQPNHPEYFAGNKTRRTRTMLAASIEPLRSSCLEYVAESSTPVVPWDPSSNLTRLNMLQKLRHFVSYSLTEKLKSMKRIVNGS
ncbi:MAG: class I SAM-dependent methyltransferase [Candidatus Acidiferrales bacterium]